MTTPTETRVSIKKLDAKKQIVYGEVYVPYVPDSQGDFMTPEEIERVAHAFLKKGRVDCIDTEHNLVKNGSGVVESFVARDGDPDFTPGSWVLGVHIPDKDHWAKAERGDIGGFSMYGTGRRQQRVVEIEVPDDGVLFGKTAATPGNGAHDHMFALDFDTKGNFLGGETDEVNGHSHRIVKGTVTEAAADGHRHRFSFVDTLVKGCSGMTKEQKKWKKIRENMKKGDFPGHPFRGNQYMSAAEAGAGGGGGTIKPGDAELQATLRAHGLWDQVGQKVFDKVGWAGASDKAEEANALMRQYGAEALKAKGVADRNAAGDRREANFLAREAERSEMAENARAKGGYQPVGNQINHAEYPERLKTKTLDELNFIRRDAHEAMKANPSGPKAGYYADEINYAEMEIARRQKAGDMKPVELTRSGHRPLSTIAREIRRDWGGKVNYAAKPYLDAMASLYDIKENYGMDTAESVVAYFLSNARGWKGDKAKEVKAELKKIIGIRKEDMTEEDLPESDGEQAEVRCKDCKTPKACGKAGRCLISSEAEEDDEEEEDEE